MPELKSKDLLDIIHRKWNRPIGLFAAYILLVLILAAVFSFIDIDKTIVYIVSAILLFAIFIAWLSSRRFPRIKKGKIGFVVNFNCSNEQDEINFKEDFIDHLQKLINNSVAGDFFQFIDVSKKVTKSIIDQDDAQWLRAKTRAHFILYGKLKKRMIKGESTYVLEMDGLVAHRPIPVELSRSVAIEFTELLPRKILIKSTDDVFNFEFTSTWAGNVAKYIIAIAAALSYDYKYSVILLSELNQSLQLIKTDFPILLKLQALVLQRLAELDILRARLKYDAWQKGKNISLIKEAKEYLERTPEPYRHSYEYINLMAILLFLSNRQVKSAIEILKGCKKIEDPTWHMNLAFLYAYEENLHDAIREYKKAIEYSFEPDLILQIEEFLCWCIDSEPDKYQLYYLLGYFNWQIKGDKKQAIEDFKIFIKNCQNDKFEKEKDISLNWINQIKKGN